MISESFIVSEPTVCQNLRFKVYRWLRLSNEICPKMTDRTIGPFQIERQIGVGGMGLVYSAIYPENGKRVAVKVLSPGLGMEPKLVKRFEREIEILKRLNHPNIVKYYGGGTQNNQRYYAMEFIDGGSLQEVLKARGRLPWDKALHVGRQVAAALEHAHNAGIIHRDLKPANLFLSKKGRIKLGDFGIARDTEATALTAAGKTVGTYAYMAPEQIQAGFPISRKTDLYALGCLLYEVIVGETPFQSENPVEMLMQHLNDEPYEVCEKVPDCPIALNRLIARMLAKDPDDRPYDALAVHTELGEIRDELKGGPPIAQQDTSAGSSGNTKAETKQADASAKKKKKRKKKKKKDVPFHERTWFLATCLLALIGATIWLLLPPGEDWYADHWREAMQGDEYAQRSSLEDHIDPYLAKFPEGRYRDQAQELSDTLHANMLEPQLKNMARMDREIRPEFKAECVEAARLEDEEGLVYVPTWETPPKNELKTNPLPALERWHRLTVKGQALLASLESAAATDSADDNTKQGNESSDEQAPDEVTTDVTTDGTTETDTESTEDAELAEIRWLTRLCDNHHEFFRAKLIDSSAARSFLHERMMTAEELYAGDEADKQRAREIWHYCYTEFQQVARFREFADYARLRFNGSDAEVPAADENAKPAASEDRDAPSEPTDGE